MRISDWSSDVCSSDLFHAAAVEQVQEEGAQDVVAVMAQGNLCGAQLRGYPVQNAAPQARAQRTRGFSFRNDARDDGVGVLVFDMKGYVYRAQVVWQYVLGKARLFLVQVDSDDVEIDGRSGLERQQDVQHGV